jgi:hypothetical protein
MASTREFLVPLLSFLGDGEIHSIMSCYVHLTKKFPSEKRYLKSRIEGKTKIGIIHTADYIRTADAIHVLRQGKLLKNIPHMSKLGYFTITYQGLELLREPNIEIKRKILELYEHWDKQNKKKEK